MATDATGAPTALGIPTYNTNVDAPSGLGFNATMAIIDGLISGRIALPVTPRTNNALIWNGTAWVNGPVTTTSTWAGGPPASPSDGDVWRATNVDANGARWEFQYNAGSASAFKWEFIGGGEVSTGSNVNAVMNTLTQVGATGVYYSPLTTHTPVRAGDYHMSGQVVIDPNTAAIADRNLYRFGGVGLVDSQQLVQVTTSSTTSKVTLPFHASFTNLPAATIFGIAYQGTVATDKVLWVMCYVRPIRIS